MSSSREAGARSRSTIVIVAAGLGGIVGVVLLVAGVLALGQASETKDEAAQLRRERRAVVARTDEVEREADAPIGQAEKVATSVSSIFEAGDTVITKSAAASDVLARAVQLANDGNLGEARNLYSGEAATSVQELNDNLAKARAAQAAARQAVADLTAPSP